MSNGIVEKALNSLGRGFDLASDFRLKFCKGKERLVFLNEAEKTDLTVPGFGAIQNVSIDIKCDKGERTRYQSDILEFHQMSELFNQKSSVPGKIPSGMFNTIFGFESGSWAADATNTKYLGLDGYFIILFNLHIDRYPLLLSDDVRNAVPSSWDPSALSRFIEKYGTHIIVGLSIGGQNVVLVRQDKSSNLGPSELKQHLDNLGDELFTGTCNFTPKAKELKYKVPQAFKVFDPQPSTFNSFSSITTKDGITVICTKRGGEISTSSHHEWLPTVPSTPDAIQFSFIPITSLLKGVPGKGFLSHAINLYLRYSHTSRNERFTPLHMLRPIGLSINKKKGKLMYEDNYKVYNLVFAEVGDLIFTKFDVIADKPPISDLQYFLDFQTHKIWAPVHNDLPLGPSTNVGSKSPALHFSLMGPKLYVNTSQVIVGKRPVTGMRFYLEGMKCNRLAIHLQHPSNTPEMLQNKIDDTPLWRRSEDIDDDRFCEAINGKKFSHICTAPVKYNPRWSTRKDVAYIVTGAKLYIKKHDSKSVLHLGLLFSKVSHSFVVQSNWAQSSSGFSQKSGLFSAFSTSITGNPAKEKPQVVVVDSSVFPSGPPVPVQTQKLLKFVDTSQLCRGPQDSPGHWLATGARLDLDKGKICLQVKFSLLNIC